MIRPFAATLLLLAVPYAAATAQATTSAAPAVRPAPFDVTEASVTALQRAMSTGRATSANLVDAYLARIAAYDHAGPALNTMALFP